MLLQADEASCFIQQASYLLYDTNDNNSNYIYILTLLYVRHILRLHNVFLFNSHIYSAR